MTHSLMLARRMTQLGKGGNAKAAGKTPKSQPINCQMDQNSSMHVTKGMVTPSKRHADADDDGFGGPDSSLNFIFEVTHLNFRK